MTRCAEVNAMRTTLSNGTISFLDAAVGLVAGYVGTKMMEPVSSKLYHMESEEDRKREKAVRPDQPYRIAAEKTAKLLHIDLTEAQRKKAGLLVHFGLGMSWGVLYTILRRYSKLSPGLNGLITGSVMSAVIDEGLTPALGFSAPNRAYPLSTHLRGFAAHLVFGLGVAGTSEILYALIEKTSDGRK